MVPSLRYVRSTIAGESLVPLLEAAYDLPRPLSCVLHARGDNDNYFVTAGGIDGQPPQRYVLRLYRADKHWWNAPEQNVRFELEWTRYARSEEHTSELQSQSNLVCRLLLEKKNKK